MKRLLILTAVAGALSLGLAAPAVAGSGNPSGTGRPGQTCLSKTAPNEPGNASSSPGSPFNEPSATSSGGIGGSHYAGNGPATVNHTPVVASQYDVACFHVS
jgi:uncharacterized low-complexity protein